MAKKNNNLNRVIAEYYMLKRVLNNPYVSSVLNNEITATGLNGAADRKTLLAMKEYVDTLGAMKVASETDAKGETFDALIERLMSEVMENENSKSENSRLEFVVNPFDDKFRDLVKAVLETENSQARIQSALDVNTKISEQVSSLPVLIGGKKQSSYVSVLSQCIEMFSNVSGLENQISTLKKSGSEKDSQIQKLQEQIDSELKKSEELKGLLDKSVSSAKKDAPEFVALLNIVKKTNEKLDELSKTVVVQAKATRMHVTNEANRVVENVGKNAHEPDKIKRQILEHLNMYPKTASCYNGTILSKKEMRDDVMGEIAQAAKSIGINPKSDSVSQVYTDVLEWNTKNAGRQNGATLPPARKMSKTKKAFIGILIALGVAGTAFGGAYLGANNGNTASVGNDYQTSYTQYVEREVQEKNDYMEKLNMAIDGDTLVTFSDEDTNAQTLSNNFATSASAVTLATSEAEGETVVWTSETLKELRDEYAADDQIDEYGWSSTAEIDAETSSAIANVKADYYESNYSSLLSTVSALHAKIDELTAALADETASKEELQSKVDYLQSQVDYLQSQIDSLQEIIDAAKEKYDADTSELQSKIDELQSQVDDLQSQVDDLEAENAELKEENEALKSEISSLNNQIAELNDLIMELKYRNSVLSTEKAALQSQVNSLKSQVADLQAQIDSMEEGGSSGGSSSTEVAELQAKVDELTAQLSEAEKTISELKSTNEELTAQILALKSSVSDLESSVSDLESAIESLTEENASLKSEVSALQSSLTSAINDYNTLYSAYDELVNSGGDSAEIEALKAELATAYSTILDYENKIVALYNGLTKSSSTYSEAMQDLEALLKLFGIDYQEPSNPSYGSSSEYQPGD